MSVGLGEILSSAPKHRFWDLEKFRDLALCRAYELRKLLPFFFLACLQNICGKYGGICGNMREYMGNMKKYVENMREYVEI